MAQPLVCFRWMGCPLRHAEIAESFPDSAGISYSTAVALIGQANMETTLLMVAGADGNYVG